MRQVLISVKRPTFSLALGALLLCSVPAGAAPLTLKGAIRLALAQNPEIRASILQYQASGASVGEARGLYDPRLRLLLDATTSRDVQSVIPQVRNENQATRAEFSLLQKLPSGADLSLGVSERRDDNLRPTLAVDPAWRNELRLTLTQPLLKNFGRTATEEPILLAMQGQTVAAETMQESATAIVADLHALFAEIRRSRDIIASRRSSVGLAEQILKENQAKVDAGVLPPLDVLEAEYGLKSRQRDLLDAVQSEKDLQDRLAERLRLPETVEVELDPFVLSSPVLSESADLDAAFALRSDLRRAEAQVKSRRIEEETAQKRRLPALDLNASYAQKGFDSNFGGSVDQSLSRDLPNWEIGLTLTYPLGNRQAENEALRKKYQADAAQSEVERLREMARREVRSAIRQLEVGRLRLEVTEQGVTFAAEKLKNLLKRREVGLSTTRDVLQGEDDLAKARTDRADAEVSWARALTDYLRASGRLLDHEGIRLVETERETSLSMVGPTPP